MEIPQTFAPVVIEQIVEIQEKIRETRAIESEQNPRKRQGTPGKTVCQYRCPFGRSETLPEKY